MKLWSLQKFRCGGLCLTFEVFELVACSASKMRFQDPTPPERGMCLSSMLQGYVSSFTHIELPYPPRELDANELDSLTGPGSFLILLFSDSRMGLFFNTPSSTMIAE